jgi:hypothetical protein
MTTQGKLRTVGVIFLLLLGVAGWQLVYYKLHYGYGNGTRTGLIRKLSVNGPPGCKYYTGELVLPGNNIGQPEKWQFSIDDYEKNPLQQKLETLEKSGKAVTLRYRLDRPMWWRFCNPSEYFITDIDAAP